MLDGGAPWYLTYPTSDGRYIAVGALEEPFWQELLDRLDIVSDALPPRTDRAGWDTIRAVLAQRFLQRTRDEWATLFADSDACVSPVLGLLDAPAHEHVASRGTFIDLGGVTQPAPAPRFSRTPGCARLARSGPDEVEAVFDSGACNALHRMIAAIRHSHTQPLPARTRQRTAFVARGIYQ